MSAAFSQPLDNVLHAIDPRKRPANQDCFPRECRDVDLRVGPGESVQAWFARLVDGSLQGNPQPCMIEDNLAVFLQFAWSDGRRFRYVRCQSLAVVGGTIENAYLGFEGAQLRYLRFEYDADPLASGSLFSHPVAHVHAQPSDAPRFTLDSDHGAILIDFFDFLYRNFCHASWSRWADSVWRRAAPDADSAAFDDGPLCRVRLIWRQSFEHAPRLHPRPDGVAVNAKAVDAENVDPVFAAAINVFGGVGRPRQLEAMKRLELAESNLASLHHAHTGVFVSESSKDACGTMPRASSCERMRKRSGA